MDWMEQEMLRTEAGLSHPGSSPPRARPLPRDTNKNAGAWCSDAHGYVGAEGYAEETCGKTMGERGGRREARRKWGILTSINIISHLVNNVNIIYEYIDIACNILNRLMMRSEFQVSSAIVECKSCPYLTRPNLMDKIAGRLI